MFSMFTVGVKSVRLGRKLPKRFLESSGGCFKFVTGQAVLTEP